MALSREAIVDAGLAILDEYGLGDLSMRRVADALGVQAGALYYHVPNKQSLLAAIADEILRATLVEPTAGSLVEPTAATLVEPTAGSLVEPTAGSLVEPSACEERAAAVVSKPGELITLPDHLSTWAHDLRSALLRHRDAAELVASTHALGLGTVDPTAPGRTLLAEAGHPEPEATMAALLHFVLGHVVEEQTRAQMQALGVIDRFDQAVADHHFRVGVATFVRGISQ